MTTDRSEDAARPGGAPPGARSADGEGSVETLDGDFSRGASRRIELVFRTVGERTSELALALAIEHVRPHRVHVLRDVKPFARAVERMLRLPHDASHVVHMDADCLILEDLRPFLDANERPYVDCYVHDRFRGRIHCGVHITSVEVLRRMAAITPPVDDRAYVLRPESRLRNLALAGLGAEKQLKSFHILHDHFQHPADVFVKYAVRELRSREGFHRARLSRAMARWPDGVEFAVARAAVEHARHAIPGDAPTAAVAAYIRALPGIAADETSRMGLAPGGPLTRREVEDAMRDEPRAMGPRPTRPKVFGLGLSRTGTRSLTAALHALGFDTVHYPIDAGTLATLERGDARFPLLDHYDGLTDITVAPYFEDLDQHHPGSKFILTLRDEESWLRSCRNHWQGRAADEPGEGEAHRVHMAIRRFLRAAVYGAHAFDEARFRRAYRRHVDAVRRYFEGRPGDLLELRITDGEGYERLAPFLGVEVPDQPFPHKGRRLGERLAESLQNLDVDD